MALPKLVISLVEFDATKIADDLIRHRGLPPRWVYRPFPLMG